MLQLNIGGVPEHFNFPWIKGIKDGDFERVGIDLNWSDCHGGTGEMTQSLRNGTLDIAVLLTEGITKDIIEGNPSKLVHTYVNSSLKWGVHVATDSKYEKLEDLKGKNFAISRYKSGSHLMSFVMADNLKWKNDDVNFVVINNLQGGINSLKEHTTDAFLWEKFTTNPFVIDGKVRRIGEVPTPWPCFSIAVRNEILEKHPDAIKSLLEVITSKVVGVASLHNLIALITAYYNLKEDDVKQWFHELAWNHHIGIDTAVLDHVQNTLLRLEIISKTVPSDSLVHQF